MDVAAVKLFASNRNGAEPIDVILRDLTIHADRINGLGTVDPHGLRSGRLRRPDRDRGRHPARRRSAQGGAGRRAPQVQPRFRSPPAATAPGRRVRGAGGRGRDGRARRRAVVMVAAAPAARSRRRWPPHRGRARAGPAARREARPCRQPRRRPDPFAPDAAAIAVFAPAPAPAPPPPKAKIPLDELESIRFERTPVDVRPLHGPTQPRLHHARPERRGRKTTLAREARRRRSPTTDRSRTPRRPTGPTTSWPRPRARRPPPRSPRSNPKKNGIRDLNLSLFNLRPAAIKQVTVTCQTDKGPTSWRLDTTDSQDWPLVVRRSGTEPSADLFLEPPPGDCFEKDFTIAVVYADGQNANANAKAEAHTKPDLAVDPKAPAIEPLDVWLYLTGDEKLYGKLEGISQDAVRITTPWQDHLDVPLSRIVGIHLGLLERKETAESFARRLKSRGSEDQLLAQTKTGEVVAIPGIVEGTEDDKLRFQYKGRTRTLPLKQVEGLVMAARPEADPADELRTTFHCPATSSSPADGKASTPASGRSTRLGVRDFPDCGSHPGAARRRFGRRAHRAAETAEPELVRMMVGRDLTALFPRSARRIGGHDAAGPQSHHARMSPTSASRCGRGRSWRWPGSSAPAARSSRMPSSATRPILSGQVEVEGRPLTLRSPRDAVRAGLALAPEERKQQALLMKRSVRDNICLAVLEPAAEAGASSAAPRKAGSPAAMWRNSGSAHRRSSRRSRRFPGGNQQKTVLARWLARRGEGADSGRADARRGCRRQGRHLCHHRQARGGG